MAHPFMRVVVVSGLVLAGFGAEPAGAGTFHVYGLGLNGAGCPNGWQAQTLPADRFRQGNFCSRWEIQSVRDGTALQQGDFAGTSMFAGDGARFTGFSIKSSGTAQNGAIWQMAMCATPFASCQHHFPKQGTWSETETQLGSLAPGGSPFYATHLWAGVTCATSSCADSGSGRPRRADHARRVARGGRGLHAAGRADRSAGSRRDGTPGRSSSGTRRPTPAAGSSRSTLTVDGSLHRTINHSCARLPAGGYTQPVPCATATNGEFTVNEPGQLADGRHTLDGHARDAGGEAASSRRSSGWTTTRPATRSGLTVEGGDGWRGENDFAVTWENPDQGSGSAIAGAYYKIGSAPTSPTDGTRVSGAGLTQLSRPRACRATANGRSYVWLRDEAGNADHGAAAAGAAPPRHHRPLTRLRQRPTRRPPRSGSRRPTSTAASPAGRSRSGAAASPSGARSRRAARAPSSSPRSPTTSSSAARTSSGPRRRTRSATRATTTRRADGREMVVDLPVRGDTTLSASLSRRSAGRAPGAAGRIRIGYRKRAWLRGVLRSGGALLPDTRLAIHTRRLDRQRLAAADRAGHRRQRRATGSGCRAASRARCACTSRAAARCARRPTS